LAVTTAASGVRGIFGAMTTVNLVAFLVLVIGHIDNLGTVTIEFGEFGGGETTEMSLYDIFETVLTIFAGVALVGILASFFGGGGSVGIIVRFVAMIVIVGLLSVGVSYYLSVYPPLSTAWALASQVVMALYLLFSYMESEVV